MDLNQTKSNKATKINKEMTKELKDLNFGTILQDGVKLLVISVLAKKLNS